MTAGTKPVHALRILLSNDDGIDAQGLNILADTLRDIVEVTIVAPDRNRSGASNSITLDTPLRVRKVTENSYAVQGTPTDCVHFALNELMKDARPDLVLTGINHGANLGDDVLYSGTVAAAMEGHFLGIQSIALSLVGKDNLEAAAQVARQLVEQYIRTPLTEKQLINVNIPDLPFEQLGAITVTRLGSRDHIEDMVKHHDPRGEAIYWLGPPGRPLDAGVGTDFHTIEQGSVSFTPLQVDLTAHSAFAHMNHWLQERE